MISGKRRALLVGVDTHRLDAWTPIPYVRNDIEGPDGLASVLQHDLGSRCFDHDNIYTLLGSEATSTAIEHTLQRICITDALEGEDEVLFYFSGHGIIHRTVNLPLLVTYETNPNSPHKTGITLDWLRGLAGTTRARLVIVIDACFSGRIVTDLLSDSTDLADSAAQNLTEIPNAAVFASCQPEETSGPSPGKTRSLFTSLFIDGLRGKANALDAGRVTTFSLRNWLTESLAQEPQRPSIHLPDEPWILSIPKRALGITPPTAATREAPWEEYLKASVLRYEESRLHSRHAFAQLTADITSFSPTNSGDGDFNQERPQRKKPVLNVLEDLTTTGQPQVVVLLGDVGSGKTTILKRTWYRLAQKALSNVESIVPVEVPLALFRDIRFDEVGGDHDASVQTFKLASAKCRAIFTDLLQYEYGVPLTWSEIEEQLCTGKVALFFDGLDEMGVDSRLSTIHNCLRILCQPSELGAVVIISCRTHFLRNNDELVRSLRTILCGTIPFSLVCLHKFTQTQVTHYIDHMSESTEVATQCHNFLEGSFRGSNQLARRPFLLEILVQANEELVGNDGHPTPEYLVFQKFLSGWLERDRWRFSQFLSDYRDAVERDIGQLISPDTQKNEKTFKLNWAEQTIVYFIELLANDLRIKGRKTISYREIPDRIRDQFPTLPEVFLNFFEYTLRTCSFLVRDESGEYEFLHPSIHSYFAARAILHEIQRERYSWDAEGKIKPVPHSLGRCLIDETVRELLRDMLKMNVDDCEALEKWIRYKPSFQNPNTLRYLAGNCLLLLSDLQDNCLVEYDLNNSFICGVELRGVDLSGSDLRSSVLDSVNLEDADLTGALIEGSKMNSVRFGGTTLTGVVVENGATVISNPIGLEMAKGVPDAINKIVELTEKGERKYQQAVADNCEMKLIDGARFWMGAQVDDTAAEPMEGPEHEVVVSPFWLDVHPVTNRQFKRFVEANPDWGKAAGVARTGNVYYLSLWVVNNRPPNHLLDHPVVYVNWYAAAAYADWAGKRLPTEAEWELALRDRNHHKRWPFPWGPNEAAIPPYLQNKLKPKKADGRSTYKVFSLPANSYGLYDLTGNVNEWVEDWVDPNYWPGLRGAVSYDPTGPSFGREKVLRGGSFLSHRTHDFRCYFRRWLLPSNTNQDGGFRCAMDVDSRRR